jgi:hypothetical protein
LRFCHWSVTSNFYGSSPDCEDVNVAGTIWSGVGDATMINKGGSMGRTIHSNCFNPSERYMLLERDIIDLHACWLKKSNGKGYVQAGSDANTFAAFYVVTGEFRVK